MTPPLWMALITFATAGSPMNSWIGTITVSGALPRARSARPWWQITTSASAGIVFTGVCSTVTSFFFSWRLSVLASITLLPIPASQATTSFFTSLPLMVCTLRPPWELLHG